MCLTVYRKSEEDEFPFNVAETDVECYKILYDAKKLKDFFDSEPIGSLSVRLKEARTRHVALVYGAVAAGIEYVSPYRCSPYVLGRKYTCVLDKVDASRNNRTGKIEVGLHTYKLFEDAEQALTNVSEHTKKMSVIMKGHIPKGSNYYDGWFDTAFQTSRSFASNALIIDEIAKSCA